MINFLRVEICLPSTVDIDHRLPFPRDTGTVVSSYLEFKDPDFTG